MFIEKELGNTFDEIYQMTCSTNTSFFTSPIARFRQHAVLHLQILQILILRIISKKIANFPSATRFSSWFCRCWWNFASELVCRHFLGFSQMLYFGRQCRITLNSPKCCRFPPKIGIVGPRKCKRKNSHVNDDSKSHTERLVVHPRYIRIHIL